MNKKTLPIVAAFLLLAAVAIVIGIKFRPAGASYSDGVWTGTAEGRNGPISLNLTVRGGKIVSGEIVSEDETDFAKPAEQKVIDQLVKTQNPAKLDTVSGATITSKATAGAIAMALALAKGETVQAAAPAASSETCDIVVIGAARGFPPRPKLPVRARRSSCSKRWALPEAIRTPRRAA